MIFSQKIKERIKIIKIFFSYFTKFNKYYWRPYLVNDLSNIIERYANLNGHIFFMQIGSNDGISNDPINRFINEKKWEGVLIEPIQHIYKNLKLTYKNNSNLIFLNAAIAPENGFAEIYKIDDIFLDKLPAWCNQLSSFKKEVIESHEKLVPGISKKIVQEKVETFNIDTIIKNYSIKKVNLLHIDTEGYDFEILKLVNFANLEVELILFENKHLSEFDFKSAINLLKANNFFCIYDGYDTLCIRNEYLTKLRPIKTSPFFIRSI